MQTATTVVSVSAGESLGRGSGHPSRSEASDGSLWERTRAGNTDAFGHLFERHAKVIYNYCFRSVGDWSAAEDLLSSTFLEAWRRRDKELRGEDVLPWLYGIATNLIRNRRRSERRFAAALRRMPELRPEPDFATATDEFMDDEQRLQHALALLQQLPQREREVFILCAWMELGYEAAAVALELPIGTVRSRLSRARAHLRELDSASGHIQSGSTSHGDVNP